MRKALQYLSALSDETSVEWVKAEPNGYEYGQWKDRKDFPKYRCLRGFLRIRDGWGRLRPLQTPKDVEEAAHCQLQRFQSIAQPPTQCSARLSLRASVMHDR